MLPSLFSMTAGNLAGDVGPLVLAVTVNYKDARAYRRQMRHLCMDPQTCFRGPKKGRTSLPGAWRLTSMSATTRPSLASVARMSMSISSLMPVP